MWQSKSPKSATLLAVAYTLVQASRASAGMEAHSSTQLACQPESRRRQGRLRPLTSQGL